MYRVSKVNLSKVSVVLVSSALLSLSAASALAQQALNDASVVAPVWRTDVTGSFTQQTGLLQLVPFSLF